MKTTYFFLIGTLLCTSAVSELDIYSSVLDALKELKDRERACRLDEHVIQLAASVCYDDLGCFDTNGTFKHLKQLPDTPENIATQFLLYTKKNSEDDQAELLDYRKPKTIERSSIDKTRPLKFITHGFGGKNQADWMWKMKDAFILREGANVIIVDWSNGAAIPHYINSAVNAELVGAQITALYYLIKEKYGILEKDLHGIGFSLGAQVMGFVGKRMRKLRKTRPARITGLDPAGPLYEDYGKDVHLYLDDADHVDVIHTNADLLIYGGLGIRNAIGHVDYYPNGGIRQPGCNSTLKGLILDLWGNGERQKVCNHERAVLLFLQSIWQPAGCEFLSYECEDYKQFEAGRCYECSGEQCGTMGYNSKGSGKHYLLTHSDPPYCAESLIFSMQFADENEKSYGAIIITLVGASGAEQNVTVTKEKDERLNPGDSRTFTAALDPKLLAIKQVRLTYLRFNGWFAKGTLTFTIAKVSVTERNGKSIFSYSQNRELSDGETVTLPSS